MDPKYPPAIVIVGSVIDRFAEAAVMTGWLAALAGNTPNMYMYILPSTARQADVLLLRNPSTHVSRWCAIEVACVLCSNIYPPFPFRN
jgi:hypothetical protein